MRKTKRALILRAAGMLFANKGFKETSVKDISQLTGAAEGTIFHHFKSKEHILETILEDFRDWISLEYDHYFKDKTFRNGMHMLEEVISFYLYLAGLMEDHFLLLHRHFVYQLAETSPACRGHLEAIYSRIVDQFEKAVLSGQEDGSIASLSARRTALLVFTMVDGLVRFKIYNLYDAGALYNDLIGLCRKMLSPGNSAAPLDPAGGAGS